MSRATPPQYSTTPSAVAVQHRGRCRACAPDRRGRGSRPRPTTGAGAGVAMTSRGTWSRMACSRPRAAGVADEVELRRRHRTAARGLVGVHRGAVAVEDDDGVVGGADHPEQPVEQLQLADVSVWSRALPAYPMTRPAGRAPAVRRCAPMSSGLRRATRGTRGWTVGLRHPRHDATAARQPHDHPGERWPTGATPTVEPALPCTSAPNAALAAARARHDRPGTGQPAAWGATR
jgi:hypothetical protein